MSDATERPFDAGDPVAVKKRKTKAELRKERDDNDLREVLGTDAGKRLLWRLLSECGIHRDPFHTNALVMAKAVGAQSIGRFIECEIAEACPEKFLEMQLMAQQEEANG